MTEYVTVKMSKRVSYYLTGILEADPNPEDDMWADAYYALGNLQPVQASALERLEEWLHGDTYLRSAQMCPCDPSGYAAIVRDSHDSYDRQADTLAAAIDAALEAAKGE